jgi:hypothetical protein
MTPYLDPYYQAYVAPQVEKVQPYWDTFDNQVYTPVAGFTKEKYTTYGAHRVEQAQHHLAAQWDKSVRPLLQDAQDQVKGQYDIHLEPYVKRVSDAVMPLYEQTKESTLEIYHLTLLPTYEAVLPYSRQAYAHGHYTVSHIIFPYVRSAKNVSWTFITRTLWPQLRILYGDNVEPQLVRIRERLGRHRDQQKMESAVEGVESSLYVHVVYHLLFLLISIESTFMRSKLLNLGKALRAFRARRLRCPRTQPRLRHPLGQDGNS